MATYRHTDVNNGVTSTAAAYIRITQIFVGSGIERVKVFAGTGRRRMPRYSAKAGHAAWAAAGMCTLEGPVAEQSSSVPCRCPGGRSW
ncbi:hypothetical protein GCM10022226_01060 [Sphaerisporangium flaviroseum]|uniref:Uncharacterized protein n=1 Tax=Sphaerisporangium flaviroseum TaxID=509199 RepID=A0ABP7H9Y4_9ACTN